MKREAGRSADCTDEPPEPRRAAPIHDEDSAPKGGHAWQLLLGGGLLLTLLYIAVPYGIFASTVYVAVSFIAALAVALAVHRRPRLFCPRAWALLAGGLALTTIGHVIWYWFDLTGRDPFPSFADVFYLAAYPLFMAALWMLGRQNGRDGGAFIDALIVGVSAAVLGWALLIAPYMHDPALGMVQLLVSAAYPVADLILLPLILRLLFLYRAGIRAHQFLLAGMLAYFMADVLYAHGNSVGWYVPGGVTDGLWLIAYPLFAAAVWHPSARVEPQSRAASAELSRRRLLLLGAAAMTVPAVILLTAGTNAELVRIAAVGSILLFLLVMHRMAGLMRRCQQQAEQLASLSRTDPLTGAANRRHLEHELVREIARAERLHTVLSLAFLDLDHFKQYNDTHGHAGGDRLLQKVVAAWRGALRPTDVLARTGGEEFVVVLPDTGAEQSRAVVERLRELVPDGQTCSAGIAVFEPGETAEALLERADRALYAAKHGGRDRAVLADAGTPVQPRERRGPD